MDIEEAISLLESTYVAEDIKKLSPKDRLAFWASIKEFVKPKIQRSTHELNASDIENIEIKYPEIDESKP